MSERTTSTAAPGAADAPSPPGPGLATMLGGLSQGLTDLAELLFYFCFALAVTVYAQGLLLALAIGTAVVTSLLCVRAMARSRGRPEDTANLRLLMIALVLNVMSMRNSDAMWLTFLYAFVCMLLFNAAHNIQVVSETLTRKATEKERGKHPKGARETADPG